MCERIAADEKETANLVHKPASTAVLGGEECMACFKVTLFYSSNKMRSSDRKNAGKEPREKLCPRCMTNDGPGEDWGAPLAATISVSIFHPIVDGSPSFHRFVYEWSDLCGIRGIWKAQREAETNSRDADLALVCG